jgi:hypothetical protein
MQETNILIVRALNSDCTFVVSHVIAPVCGSRGPLHPSSRFKNTSGKPRDLQLSRARQQHRASIIGSGTHSSQQFTNNTINSTTMPQGTRTGKRDGSRTRHSHPASLRPLLTIASAACLTNVSLMWSWKVFQVLQPARKPSFEDEQKLFYPSEAFARARCPSPTNNICSVPLPAAQRSTFWSA